MKRRRKSGQRDKKNGEAIIRTMAFIPTWEAIGVLHKISCNGLWAENRLNWPRVGAQAVTVIIPMTMMVS